MKNTNMKLLEKYPNWLLEKYPNWKRVEIGLGSARYVKATEWRVTNTETGETKSFWTKREAAAFIKAGACETKSKECGK